MTFLHPLNEDLGLIPEPLKEERKINGERKRKLRAARAEAEDSEALRLREEGGASAVAGEGLVERSG